MASKADFSFLLDRHSGGVLDVGIAIFKGLKNNRRGSRQSYPEYLPLGYGHRPIGVLSRNIRSADNKVVRIWSGYGHFSVMASQFEQLQQSLRRSDLCREPT
jgi:hypothetical protein